LSSSSIKGAKEGGQTCRASEAGKKQISGRIVAQRHRGIADLRDGHAGLANMRLRSG
jgi:hypothetical protein